MKFKNTKKQGDFGLGVAICWFTTHGYTVCIPLTDSQDYDLVVDKDGNLQRVQVKTTTYKVGDHYKVSLTVKGGNRSAVGRIKKFDKTQVDQVFIVTGEHHLYLIPSFDVITQYLTLDARYAQFEVGYRSMKEYTEKQSEPPKPFGGVAQG